ncbi:MAG: hypothetical protein IPH07_39850 [Deltaproteobacteria bacterium]|nr:hypothetical protein [Deltaproteobacteria bacterium]MBK8713985.1 hypothetical protein [Deltaproteobacteria bacterium]
MRVMRLRELIFVSFVPFAVLLWCGCSDRTVVDDPERDEEVEACEAFAEWARACGSDSTVEMCLSNYFDELLDPCRDVALNRTRCYPEQVCGDDAIAACRDVSNPFSVCSADPQSWAAAGCDASKCPGECCRGEEPCQGVDANCPWYKPVCNDQTGLCMEAP